MLNSKTFSDKLYSDRVNKVVYGPSTLVSFKKVIKMLPSRGRVLDIGCYNGYLMEKILEKGSEYDVYGVDASKESIRLCTLKNLKVFETDAENKLPFEDDFFDVITGLEVIELIVDTDSFLNEIKRVLKRVGILILAIPNVLSLSRRIMSLLGINPFFEASFSFPPEILAGHVRFFSHNLLEKFLEYHNFKVIENKSDVINFSNNEKFFSELLADIFPKFGRGVLIKAINIK